MSAQPVPPPPRRRPSVSAVIPVFNAEASIEALVRRLIPVLEGAAERHEIVLVNDGSRDRSGEVMAAIAQRTPGVRALDLMRNYGQHNALLAGIRAARHEIIVTLDDDLQNPPEEIPALLAALDRGFDVAYGAPERERHGLGRDLASQFVKLALKSAMGVGTARDVSAFRAFRTRLREAFADYQSPYVSIDVLLTWGTARFTAVRVKHEPRAAGESNYTFGKLVTHALNMMTGFSVWPLKLASLIGFAFTLLGGVVLVYVIGRVILAGRVVPGFAFLASIIAVFAGAQLFALGIIGEYLARIHFRSMEKPPYVVAGETSRGEAP